MRLKTPDGAALLARLDWRTAAPVIAAGAAFLFLFAKPIETLVLWDWWNEPEASHGILLAPLALWLAWRSGLAEGRRGQAWLGAAILVAAVLLRWIAGLAAELFTLRLSVLLALVGVTVYLWGFGQVKRWWLPFILLALSLPLPKLLIGTLSYPLQLQASALGASLLEWRQVPVMLSGNVISLPGQSLFVTEACSGLRSLTALFALGVLISGIWLRSPASRLLLVLAVIPVGILINGVRVFLTAFLVYYVDPALGRGFMHISEGLVMFGFAFLVLGAMAWLMVTLETSLLVRRRQPA